MEYIRVTSDNLESFNDRIIEIKRSFDSVKADVESANLDDAALLEKSKDLSSNMALIRPQTIPQGSFLYRLRKVDELDVIKNTNDITEFSYNHSKKKEEIVRNRLNLSGLPIFYSSIMPSTCFKELGSSPHVGNPYFFLSCWQVMDDDGIKVFPLLKSQIDFLRETQYHVLYTYFNDFYESMLEHYREDDKKYQLSAIYAHAIYDFKLDEKNLYEGIAYPSVKNTNTEEYNLALTPLCVDKKLQLKYVLRGFYDDDCIFKYDKVGINKDGKIQWYRISDVRELDRALRFDLYLNRAIWTGSNDSLN